MSVRTIAGRRGPRRAIVDVYVQGRERDGRYAEWTWEVLECGHLKPLYSWQDRSTRTGKRHCLECVRVEIGRREINAKVRAQYEDRQA